MKLTKLISDSFECVKRRIYLILWISLVLYLFYDTFIYYNVGQQFYYLRRILGFGLCISRGTATVINLCCALVLLPLCKKLNQLLYRVLSKLWPGLFFFWLEKAKSFHMTVAITLLFFAVVHSISHLVNLWNFSRGYDEQNAEINFARYRNECVADHHVILTFIEKYRYYIMPKRVYSEEDEDSDYCRKKLRKIQKLKKKIQKHQRKRKSSSDVCSSGSSPVIISPPAPSIPNGKNDSQVDIELPINDEPQPVPSTSYQSAIQPTEIAMILEPTEELNRPELDEEIMCLLGQTPSKEKKLGSDIQKDLALRLEHIATMGLKKESRKEIIENNLIPSNCTKINAPKLNPEIKAALSEILIKKDNALEAKQVQIAATISCLGNALTKIFLSDFKDQAVIKSLIEASQLLCDTQHRESMTRRSFICSSIKKDFKEQLYNTEIDSFLFGEKLADTLKAAKAISKSGAEIRVTMKKTVVPPKASQVPAQALNQKPPLPPTRRTGVARRAEPAAAPAPRSRQQQPLRHSTRSQRHHAQRH